MPWHDPKTWMLRELVTPDDMNQQIRDNLRYLTADMPVGVGYVGNAGTTTSTVFVDMNPATKVTLDLKGTRLLVILSFQLALGTGVNVGTRIELGLDNTLFTGSLYGMNGVASGDSLKFITIPKLFTGLTPGTHFINPRFQSILAGNDNFGYGFVSLTVWGL
jgi:hypothetical protein